MWYQYNLSPLINNTHSLHIGTRIKTIVVYKNRFIKKSNLK